MNNIVETDIEGISSVILFNGYNFFKNKTILITGGFSFLMSYLTRTLRHINLYHDMNMRIIVLTQNIYKHDEWLNYGDIEIIAQDVCNRVNIDGKIDIIIHGASIATPKYFDSNPVEIAKANTLGTINMLELARKHKVSKFMYVSTSGVVGFHEDSDYPLKENGWGILDPTDITNCYLESKRTGEMLCAAYRHQHDISTVIARPGMCYGPGLKRDDGRSFADFVYNILDKKDIALYSDGQEERSYMYIYDVTLGFLYVLLYGSHGEAYNVTSSESIKIIDLAKKLAHEVFPELNLNVVIKPDRNKDYKRIHFRKTDMYNTKLQGLGWHERYNIKEGFKRTVESYK